MRRARSGARNQSRGSSISLSTCLRRSIHSFTNSKSILPKDVVYCDSSYDAADGADVLVLLTEWNQFRSLDLERIKNLLRRPVVVDLRNVYDPVRMRERGFIYDGMGRAAVDLPEG